MTEPVIRYVPTCVGRDGLRTLMRAGQGRETFAAPAEAQAWIDAVLANNPQDRLVSIWGPQAWGTFEVRPCRCWPGHFDPMGVYFN